MIQQSKIASSERWMRKKAEDPYAISDCHNDHALRGQMVAQVIGFIAEAASITAAMNEDDDRQRLGRVLRSPKVEV